MLFAADFAGAKVLDQKAGDRLLSLQALRLVAALGVVWRHAADVSASLAGSTAGQFHYIGSGGVDVFFVLSGFIIVSAGPLASPRPTARSFFARRWTRVAPIYFLWSVPFIAWSVAGGQIDWARLASNLTFWPVWRGAFNYPFLVSGWTLAFEMVFYSAVAVLLIGGKTWRNMAILGAVFGFALAARILTGSPAAHFLANGLMLEFLMGAALALARKRLATFPALFGACLLAVVAAAVIGFGVRGVGDILEGVTSTDANGDLRRALAFGPVAMMAVAGAVMCEPWARKGLATFLGDASYSIYLTHLLVLDGLALSNLHLAGVSTAVTTTLATIACIGFGAAAYQFVERPLLRLLRPLKPAQGGAPMALPTEAP